MDAPKTPKTNQKLLEDENIAVDADLILQYKENIQPLASGRRAAALAGSLTTTPKQKDTRLTAERAQLEEEAELAIDNDDDPLAAWIRYVEWTVDNYPQGVSVESGLLELLERATRSFASDPRYKNDMRYLRLWIQYASYVDHPVKIYSYLNVNEIGTAYALFYEEYCNALELCGRRTEALEMYDIGIARRAYPLARLQARKRDFSVRMMSGPLDPEEPSSHSASQHERKVLGERKSSSSSHQRSETRTPSSARGNGQARSQSNNRGNFQIYADDDDQNGGGNAWPDLETRDTHRKENYRSAIPAQGQVLSQSPQDAPLTPRVRVYVDEGVNEPKTPARSNKDDGLGTLSSKKPGLDTLKRDPLRNHTQVRSEPESEPEPRPEPASRDRLGEISNSKGTVVSKTESSKGKAKSKSSKSLPSVKPNERLEINVSLLTLSDGTEIHPLERRARDSGLADKKWPEPSPEQMALRHGDEDLFSPRPDDHHVRVDFEATRSGGFGNTYTNMSKDATVTINTKEALMAVYGMYNSPTKSLTGGKIFIDPASSSAPTPMPVTAPRDENAGTVQRTPFQPFFDDATPAASKISSENQRTPALGFPSKGLSTGKRTLSLKQVLQPVTSFPEEDEEEGYEPVTPAPLRHAKPLATITPFVDEEPATVRDTLPVQSTSPPTRPYQRPGPREENDLFSVSVKTSQAFEPYRDEEEEDTAADEGDEETPWDGEEAAVPDTEEEEMYEEEGEEYDEDEVYPQEGARWAPALTPITERTYEHTGNWTTPLHVRDMSVIDTPFSAARAKREAERLAAEIRGEAEAIEEEDEGEEAASQSFIEAGDVPPAVPIICDPYTKKMTAQPIENLRVPANHRDLRPKTCGQLEKLQKFVNPKARKSASSTSRRGAEDTYSLTLDGDEYEIHRKLGEGGFGAVFLADDV
ncbi:Mitotic spindle checkpoint component mad3, partial [Serendipita sp. 399]